MKSFQEREALRADYENEREMLFSCDTPHALIGQCIKARDALRRYFDSLEKPVSDAGLLELDMLTECSGHEDFLISSKVSHKKAAEHIGVEKDAVSLFRYRMKQFGCSAEGMKIDTELMKKEWQLFWSIPNKVF